MAIDSVKAKGQHVKRKSLKEFYMLNGLTIKVVFTCTCCGNAVKMLNILYALKGLRGIFSTEGQALSSKISYGKASSAEEFRYHELIGIKRLCTCEKCGKNPAEWRRSWDFGKGLGVVTSSRPD